MFDLSHIGGVGNAAVLAGVGTYILSKAGSFGAGLRSLVFDHTTATLSVTNDMEEFTYIAEYLYATYGTHKLLKSNSYRPRFGMLTANVNGDVDSIVQLGEGTFWILHPKYGLVKAKIAKREAGTDKDSWRSLETFGAKCELSLTFITKRNRLMDFVIDACNKVDQESKKKAVYFWDGDFVLDKGTANREWDTVILPKKQKARILADVERFYDLADVYEKAGVPHRRGMMMYGPAGTGKTSLVKALHTELKLPVYIINLATVTDKSLLRAMRSVDPRSIILFEDVDSQAPSLRKGNNVHRIYPTYDPEGDEDLTDDDNTVQEEPSHHMSGQALTLSGFLNAIDGVQSPEHLYFIFTSNAPDSLDDAVVRNGRIDVKEHISYLDSELQKKLIRNVMGDIEIPPLPRSAKACDVQAACLDMLIHNKQQLDTSKIKDMS